MKQIPTEVIKVKTFFEIIDDCTKILECENNICLIYNYCNLKYNKETERKKMIDLQMVIKYFIINNNFIKKINKNLCLPLLNSYNNYYELYFKGKYYCGMLIIPKKYKQNPKDFLKEILLSKYNIKL